MHNARHITANAAPNPRTNNRVSVVSSQFWRVVDSSIKARTTSVGSVMRITIKSHSDCLFDFYWEKRDHKSQFLIIFIGLWYSHSCTAQHQENNFHHWHSDSISMILIFTCTKYVYLHSASTCGLKYIQRKKKVYIPKQLATCDVKRSHISFGMEMLNVLIKVLLNDNLYGKFKQCFFISITHFSIRIDFSYETLPKITKYQSTCWR